MKYGMRYCFLPAAFDWRLNSRVELFEIVVRRFFHQVEHAGVGVLGRHLQMPADVVLRQFAHVNRIAAG